MKVTSESIIEAGKHILVWRSIYNGLCRKCQQQVFKSVSDVKESGTQKVVNTMRETLNNNLCSTCKKVMDKKLEALK